MTTIGRQDLANAPAFEHNDGRAAQCELLDEAITRWSSQLPIDAVLDAFRCLQCSIRLGSVRALSAHDINNVLF